MATKTISIDREAYDRLISVRHDDESLSQPIKRVIRKPMSLEDYDKWIKSLEADPMSDEAVAAVEEVIRQRRTPVNRRMTKRKR